ncbi:DUF3263 domain-containing protein [Sinomonas halotolerans]|uniref:DUF3263 domain-containing protein n=1 Tax=Sinomonas halotolerans TaxID=1644133 RepID=A0ABU9WWU5_9MICC
MSAAAHSTQETGVQETSVQETSVQETGEHELDLDPHGRPTAGLTEREVQMLALERGWWKYAGAKEQAVRELFDLSATHYYQLLNALIDTEAALAHDPMLVKRLRRLRTSRQRARTARRLGGSA